VYKKTEKKYRFRFWCAVILTLTATGLFMYVWIRFVAANNTTGSLMGLGNIGMAAGLYIILYLFCGRMVRAFKIGMERKASTVAAQIIALLLTDVSELFLSLAIMGQFRFFFRLLWRYMLLWGVQSVLTILLTVKMIDLYRRVIPPLQLLEVYGDHEDELYRKIDTVFYKYHVRERMHYTDPMISMTMDMCDAVLINDIPAEKQNDLIKECFARGKRVYFVPKISDILSKSADNLNLFDTPLYLCRNRGMNASQWMIKRIFDVCASLLALIILSPVFALTALAIKLDDGGPVFFRQKRCTIGGKRFMIIKFRSMIVDAEKDGRTHPAGEHDDRITRVGKFIRATRIDELPQFVNILKGDMSVVGPRPERVEHVEMFTEQIPEFEFRNKAKGGLTGFAQVYGKYNTTALDKLKMDLIYITNFSLLMDFQIILETLKILLRKESTEGFSEIKAAQIHDYVSREH
jgi:exopolysaccharide biosynthesis polyprenyl glycosylphosphotransferase